VTKFIFSGVIIKKSKLKQIEKGNPKIDACCQFQKQNYEK